MPQPGAAALTMQAASNHTVPHNTEAAYLSGHAHVIQCPAAHQRPAYELATRIRVGRLIQLQDGGALEGAVGRVGLPIDAERHGSVHVHRNHIIQQRAPRVTQWLKTFAEVHDELEQFGADVDDVAQQRELARFLCAEAAVGAVQPRDQPRLHRFKARGVRGFGDSDQLVAHARRVGGCVGGALARRHRARQNRVVRERGACGGGVERDVRERVAAADADVVDGVCRDLAGVCRAGIACVVVRCEAIAVAAAPQVRVHAGAVRHHLRLRSVMLRLVDGAGLQLGREVQQDGIRLCNHRLVDELHERLSR